MKKEKKRFWNKVKPLFSNYGGESQKITLVQVDKIISNDEEVADTFNQFFINTVDALDIPDNNILLNATDNLIDSVEIALKKFESHPSIIDIKGKVNGESKFSFSKVSVCDKKLKNK